MTSADRRQRARTVSPSPSTALLSLVRTPPRLGAECGRAASAGQPGQAGSCLPAGCDVDEKPIGCPHAADDGTRCPPSLAQSGTVLTRLHEYATRAGLPASTARTRPSAGASPASDAAPPRHAVCVCLSRDVKGRTAGEQRDESRLGHGLERADWAADWADARQPVCRGEASGRCPLLSSGALRVQTGGGGGDCACAAAAADEEDEGGPCLCLGRG
ncbi:hypothetical protein DAEQUDRAFT_377498 [Daedalea quercina L-15889]|uniref:Uncharacterized protein n=1 Tax=Daedalea quercina L-15889 TaxID=1314783 RepID=A0A165P343_9APHY|nr:hypothetical protein DAEQUDRAFT_377498 [Daedalea quercina L-15889]